MACSRRAIARHGVCFNACRFDQKFACGLWWSHAHNHAGLGQQFTYKEIIMSAMVIAPVLFAAAGYSLLYLLMGGGLGGAILIFIVAKMLGR
jgi:hypothetical protein